MVYVRWEYKRKLVLPWREDKTLAELGADGWELCSVWWWFFYFKRPAPPV